MRLVYKKLANGKLTRTTQHQAPRLTKIIRLVYEKLDVKNTLAYFAEA